MALVVIPGAPPEAAGFLASIADETQTLLGSELVAIVLHGSLAMGSFHPPKSDIDLLILVSDLDEEGRQALYLQLADLHDRRPYAGGLEVSAIREADALAPRHPLPFLVHFGDSTAGPQPLGEGGALPTDPDLVAHLMVARTRGLSLVGPPPDEIIGKILWADYVAAVASDIDWLLEGEHLLEAPRYGVLNLCRWAMMCVGEGPLVASKEEGALWALDHAPDRRRALIAQALAAYRSESPLKAGEPMGLAGGPWRSMELLEFRDWVLTLPRPGEAASRAGSS